MKQSIENIIKEIQTGERKNIYEVSFSLEEYFKDVGGITFLEYLLKNNIEINFLDIHKLGSSIQALYLYAKYDKFCLGVEFNEEELFSTFEGKKYIDFFFEKNKFISEIIASIENHIEIIDILTNSSNTFYLSKVRPELVEKLIQKDENGNYLIEKYINNDEIIKELIVKINNPTKLIELCKKTNREDLLKYANENILLFKIDEKTTIMEYVLNNDMEPDILLNIPSNKKFINFLINKKMHKYIKNIKEEVLLMEYTEGKTLLELLIENNIIPNFNFYIYENKTIEILYKKNMLNLVTNCSNNILETKVNEIFGEDKLNDITFFEYMLDKGYNPLSNTYKISDEEKIKLYYKKGYYSFLAQKVETECLLKKLDDGKILIDVLLENNCDIDFGFKGFNDIVIAKKLYSYNRYDLLVKGNLDVLINMADNGKTYLENVLDEIKSKKLKINLNKIKTYKSNVNSIAQFYLMLAKKSMIEYLDPSANELLQDYNGKILIEELLDLDSELTLNKILNPKIKSNMKIAVILKSRGLDINVVNVPLNEKNYTSDYLDKHQKTLGIGPLFNEGEILLKRLYELFAFDGKSDIELIDALVSGYRNALFVDYQSNIIELRNLVETKEKNKRKFLYVRDDDGAFFSSYTGKVHCDSPVIETVLHETGHALHSYLSDNIVPDDYHEIIERARKNPQILQNVEDYSKLYNELRDKIIKIAEAKYSSFFETNFDQEYIDSIEEFIKKSQIEKREEFDSLGIDNEDLDIILNTIFTSDEYIKHQKKVFVEEYKDHILRSEFGAFMAIGDILDAIYEGELNSGVLKNAEGNRINRTSGHGISYYCDSKHGFDEMIANFASISKATDSMEMLALLKCIVGDEVYTMISEFYYNNISKENTSEENAINIEEDNDEKSTGIKF